MKKISSNLRLKVGLSKLPIARPPGGMVTSSPTFTGIFGPATQIFRSPESTFM